MTRTTLNQPPPTPNLKVIFGIATVLVLVILASIATFTIESGTVGVKSTFGEYSDITLEPGLHFIIPGVQSYRVLDIKMQTVHYQGKKDLPDLDGVLNKPRIMVLDSKNLNIGVEITVQFVPDKEKAKDILVNYGANYFEKLINPNIRDIVRNVAGHYQAEEIAIKRTGIGDEIFANIQDKFKGQPFVLSDIQIRNIDLPDIVRAKIEEVQLAKQEEQRLAMIEKQAHKNQQIKSIEANTILIEVTTRAKADAEKKRIEAEANAYQITKEATALAVANKQIAESITQEFIQYEAIQKWKGHYPQMLVSDKDGISMLMQLPQLDKAVIR